jgi:hypothetical protein
MPTTFYRYYLKDCLENANCDQKSVNGILLNKLTPYTSRIKVDKLKDFFNILDVVEYDPLAEESQRHQALDVRIADQKVIDENNKVKVEKIAKDNTEPIKTNIVSNSFGDIIDLEEIEKLERVSYNIQNDNITPERRVYAEMSKKQIIDCVLATNLDGYKRSDFKGQSKEDLLQTIFTIKGI